MCGEWNGPHVIPYSEGGPNSCNYYLLWEVGGWHYEVSVYLSRCINGNTTVQVCLWGWFNTKTGPAWDCYTMNSGQPDCNGFSVTRDAGAPNINMGDGGTCYNSGGEMSVDF